MRTRGQGGREIITLSCPEQSYRSFPNSLRMNLNLGAIGSDPISIVSVAIRLDHWTCSYLANLCLIDSTLWLGQTIVIKAGPGASEATSSSILRRWRATLSTLTASTDEISVLCWSNRSYNLTNLMQCLTKKHFFNGRVARLIFRKNKQVLTVFD